MKKMQKKTKRIIIWSVIGVLVAGIGVTSFINSKKPMNVNTVAASKKTMTQNLDLSGTVESKESLSVYALVDGVLDDICVEAGEIIPSGTILYKYDEEELAKQVKLAELNLQSAEGSYNDSIQRNGKTLYREGEAEVNLEVLDQQIEDWDAYVKSLQKKINDKKSAIAQYGTLLQISLLDWQDRPDSEEYLNLQKQIQWNNYESTNNSEIVAWTAELEKAQSELSEFKSYQSQMRSQENSSIDSAMTSGAKEQLDAQLETAQVEAETKSEEYEEASSGIKSSFKAIVTSVDAQKGASIAKGGKIMTLENLDNVVVKVLLAKNALEQVEVGQSANITINKHEYTGKVVKINSFAQKNDSGATVVAAEVSIDNPDDNLIIGIEAKMKLLIGQAEDALVIPITTISYDVDGSYVLVVKDGLLEKRYVELGLSDENSYQVLSGLDEGDLVVTDEADYLEEGMSVNAITEE